jgi:hypothetical protein
MMDLIKISLMLIDIFISGYCFKRTAGALDYLRGTAGNNAMLRQSFLAGFGNRSLTVNRILPTKISLPLTKFIEPLPLSTKFDSFRQSDMIGAYLMVSGHKGAAFQIFAPTRLRPK